MNVTEEVPHLSQLDVVPRRRLTGKQTVLADEAGSERSFANAWKWYIRGNVVSRHAQRLIVQFMSVNCGKSTRDREQMEETA